MRCNNPLKASFDAAGNLCYNSKNKMSGLETVFDFECRKCLPCRLNASREKGIRGWHEAQFHDSKMFLTLTYADPYLGSGRLSRPDIELFIKRLRSHVDYTSGNKLQIFGVGEYGDIGKRPHWHLIVYGFRPSDTKRERSTDRGDQIYSSEFLGPYLAEDVDNGKNYLWPWGKVEFGDVTLDSASYVARYSAKKLVHGPDGSHDYDPIPISPKGRGLGRVWIEKYYKQTFEQGYVLLPNKTKSRIPRYYTEWCKKNQPELYDHYVTVVRPSTQKDSLERAEQEETEYLNALDERENPSIANYPLKRGIVKETILRLKFKSLQERLKL